MHLAAAALLCWLAAARALPAVGAAPPAPLLDALQITGYSNVKTAEKVTEDGYSITVIRPTDGQISGLLDHMLNLVRAYSPSRPPPAPPAPAATEHGRHCNETTHASTANTSYITNPIHNFNASRSPVSNDTIECYGNDTASELTGNKSSTPFPNDSLCISGIVTNILKDTYYKEDLEFSRPWYMPPLQDSDYYYAADCGQVRCMADNSVRVLIAHDNITCGAELSRILNSSSEAVMIIIKTNYSDDNNASKTILGYLEREPGIVEVNFTSLLGLLTHMDHRIIIPSIWDYNTYFVTPSLFARLLCDLAAAQPENTALNYVYNPAKQFVSRNNSNSKILLKRLRNEFKELFIDRTKCMLKLGEGLSRDCGGEFQKLWDQFPAEINTMFTDRPFRIYNQDKTGILALTARRDSIHIECGSNTTRSLLRKWRSLYWVKKNSLMFSLVNEVGRYVNLDANGMVVTYQNIKGINWKLEVADGLSADGRPLFCLLHRNYSGGKLQSTYNLMSSTCQSGFATAPVEATVFQHCDPNSSWIIVPDNK